jgi:hypothetical protein
MQPMTALAAQVWHYWLAVPLLAGGVLTSLGVIAGYVVKVVAPRHPKR